MRDFKRYRNVWAVIFSVCVSELAAVADGAELA